MPFPGSQWSSHDRKVHAALTSGDPKRIAWAHAENEAELAGMSQLVEFYRAEMKRYSRVKGKKT